MRHIGYNIDHGGLHYSEIMSLSKLGENIGYDSVAFYDHLYSLSDEKEICLETWSLLSGIALNTKKISLLPLVTNNLFRHPGVLAKMAATVDNLSKGRLIFGIGAGWYEKEAIDFGYKFPDVKVRIAMLDESIQVISKLWTEEKTTFKGKHYSLENAESLPKPMQKPHPPILVGGKAKGVLKIASGLADWSNFTLRNLGVEGARTRLGFLKDYCSKNNRNYDQIFKTISGPCFFAKSDQELEAELDADSKRRELSKKETREMYEKSAIFGTSEQVIDQIKRYEKLGIQGAMFRFYKPMQAEKAKLFAEHIMPEIRGRAL